jgi:hypothetical protein
MTNMYGKKALEPSLGQLIGAECWDAAVELCDSKDWLCKSTTRPRAFRAWMDMGGDEKCPRLGALIARGCTEQEAPLCRQLGRPFVVMSTDSSFFD